jgi:hypothetical protein
MALIGDQHRIFNVRRPQTELPTPRHEMAYRRLIVFVEGLLKRLKWIA